MTEGGDDFTSQVSTMEDNQKCVDEEVGNNVEPASTRPSTPASNGLVYTINQTDRQTQEQ